MNGLAVVLILALSRVATRVNGAAPAPGVATLKPGQQLQGVTKTLSTGETVHVFYGVRYAEAPVGQKRFDKADPAVDWTGLRNATALGSQCMQTGADGESEDCLFLNIYTPSLTGSATVMVWFHGGGYSSGSGGDLYYDASALTKKGVVIVTVNYRLFSLGFLSTEDDVIPGNFGMLDQVEALKWVQKNIAAFGGDPNSVTIFGQSAGAGSVSLQMLSPLSTGLFHRAIMDSGSSLCIWSINRAATLVQPKRVASALAQKVNCPEGDSSSMLPCLRKVDAKVLIKATLELTKKWGVDVITTPRVETKFGFLPDYPEKLLEKGAFNKVPTLSGYNSGEFAFVIDDDENDGVTRDEFNTYFLKSYSLYSVNNETKEEYVQFVDKEYLADNTDPFVIRSHLNTAIADNLFGLGVVAELEKVIAQTNSVTDHYLYELDYQIWSDGVFKPLVPTWYGVFHSGDVFLLFHQDKTGLLGLFSDRDDQIMADKIQTMWTNFAKFGNPVAAPVDNGGTNMVWDKYTANNPVMLKLDKTSTQVTYPRRHLVPFYDKFLDYLRNDTMVFPQV